MPATKTRTIDTIMTREPVCIDPAASIRDLARIFDEYEISAVPVIAADGRVIGIVSKTDLIHRCAEGIDDTSPAYLFEMLSEEGDDSDFAMETPISVDDFMTEDPITVRPDEPVSTAAQRMVEARVHHLVVVDGGGFPVGIVTSMDMLRLLTD
jgi:predicted transcriptional regulator